MGKYCNFFKDVPNSAIDKMYNDKLFDWYSLINKAALVKNVLKFPYHLVHSPIDVVCMVWPNKLPVESDPIFEQLSDHQATSQLFVPLLFLFEATFESTL